MFQTSGVFLDDITRDLQASTTILGLALAISHGIPILYTVCPKLLRFMTLRQLTMIGSSFSVVGYISASMSTNGVHFLLSMIMTGFGMTFVLFLTHASLLIYFPDMFDVATSVMMTAGGLGMMTLPLAAEELRSTYGWRGAMLILGGFELHLLPCCALFRPLGNETVHQSDQEESADNRLTHPENISEDIQPETNCMATVKECVGSVIHADLFHEFPAFIVMGIAFIFSAISYSSWIIFVIPNALSKGIVLQHAVLLATFGGSANIAGRLLSGFVSRANIIPDYVIYCVVLLCSASAFLLNIVVDSFAGLAMLSIANGFTNGASVVLGSVVAKSFVSGEYEMKALAIFYSAVDLGEICSGAMTGAVFDASGSYNLPFSLCAVTDIITGLLTVLAVVVARRLNN
ncbi:monocarboxylate transporter 12-like [Diadema setosum]|uniref:monocarboxylate transporter 12-like n=1 Tax=Diadema setosum TaxID=31175 RepID=UPI003B3AEE9E